LQELAGAFDVILDGTGGESVGQLFNLAAPGGRIVFYGATLGNPSSVEIRRIFWKQLNVLGTTMGSPVDFQFMVDFIHRHEIHPVIDKIFSFSEGEKALRRLGDGLQFGKIILKIV
jgi:zinc-binding alcohol dehydrogenase/oxidoreductase